MVEFYHNKMFLVKLGWTLANLANICLHISTNAKVYYQFTESEKDVLSKDSEYMVGGHH